MSTFSGLLELICLSLTLHHFYIGSAYLKSNLAPAPAPFAPAPARFPEDVIQNSESDHDDSDAGNIFIPNSDGCDFGDCPSSTTDVENESETITRDVDQHPTCNDEISALRSSIQNLTEKLDVKIGELDFTTTELQYCEGNLTESNISMSQQIQDLTTRQYTELRECHAETQRFQNLSEKRKEQIQNLTDQHDSYRNGVMDTKINHLTELNEQLTNETVSSNQRIDDLNQEIGELRVKIETYEQRTEQQKIQIDRKDENIASQNRQIEQLLSDRKSTKSLLSSIAQQLTTLNAENEKLSQTATSINEYGTALAQNAEFEISNRGLNESLSVCRFIVKQNETTIRRLELEKGDYWVEWGACNMTYEQCKGAYSKLNVTLDKERNKFDLCNNMTRKCKEEKKYLKGNLTETRGELENITTKFDEKLEEMLAEKCMIRWDMTSHLTICGFVMAMFIGLCSTAGYLWKMENTKRERLESDLVRKSKEILELKKEMEKMKKMKEKLEGMKSLELNSLKKENETLRRRVDVLERQCEDEKEMKIEMNTEMERIKADNVALREEVQQLKEMKRQLENEKKAVVSAPSKKVKKDRKDRKTKISPKKQDVDAKHPSPKTQQLAKQKSMGRLQKAHVVGDNVKKFERGINEEHYGKDTKHSQDHVETDAAESSPNDSNESSSFVEVSHGDDGAVMKGKSGK